MSLLTMRRDALGLALERDDLVILAGVHLEEAMQHRLRLVVVGAAGTAQAQRLAFEVLRSVLMSWRVVMVHCDLSDSPTMYMILAPLSAACAPPEGIGAQSRLPERTAVTWALRLQFDERDVEAFGFEETLVERDVGRNVEAVAADDLADRQLGLRLGVDGRHEGERDRAAAEASTNWSMRMRVS